MRKILFLLFFSVFTTLFSQQKFSKEISFVNDNDLYASKERDQYYSNGMFLSYRYLAENSKKFVKKIYELQIGHEIYTPYKSTVLSPLLHDRPFAAHLFGSFGISRVYASNKLLKTEILFGVVGEHAKGRELQEFIHDIYNFRAPVGWKYQISNMFSMNLDVTYTESIGMSKKETTDFNLITKARIGTVYNEVSGGFLGRVGLKKLQPIENSIAFQTNLNNDTTNFVREAESFFYYQLELGLIAYDATLQGSLFNNNSPITFKPNILRFDFEAGYRFTANRWNLGYAVHFMSNETAAVRNNGGHFYGRVFLGFAFN